MIKQSQGLYKALYWPVTLLFHILHPVWKVKGRENIPEQPYIVAANHSAATDPIYVTSAIHPKKMYRIMAKKEILSVPLFGKFLQKLGAFAVDRDGDTMSAVLTSLKTLRSGQGLLIFPEGTRNRPGKTIVPKSGPVILSARCHVPIVPVYLSQKKFPFSAIRIVFGTPYYIEPEDKHMSAEEEQRYANELVEKCYALGEKA